METFRASVQYGDWEGTAAADDANVGSVSLERYLQERNLIRPGEFLVGVSFWVGENHDNRLGYVSVRALLFESDGTFESVRQAVEATTGSIPVRSVDIKVTPEEFICLFKRFSVMLTWQGLSLEGREFSAIEE